MPTIAIKDGANLLTAGTDYEEIVWPADMKNAGTKTITIKFVGNYSGSVNKTLTIKKRNQPTKPRVLAKLFMTKSFARCTCLVQVMTSGRG